MTNEELANHLRDRIKDINHEITIPQSDEAKCLLDGKRKAFQYVLDLLEVWRMRLGISLILGIGIIDVLYLITEWIKENKEWVILVMTKKII